MDFMQTGISIVILICSIILILTSNYLFAIVFLILDTLLINIFKAYNKSKDQEIKNKLYNELKNKSKD